MGVDPKGLAIKDELDDYYDTDINHGRLYPNLDVPVEKDLVEKGRLDDRTNSYSLTEESKELLRNRREWENQYLEASEAKA